MGDVRPPTFTGRALPVALLALLASLLSAGHAVAEETETSTSSAASAEASFVVPGSRKIEIRGRGYGHGHGMSQYGAQGAARQGVGWKKILKFYYPGTKRSALKTRVRVQISADTGNDVVVDSRKDLRVRAMAKKRARKLPAKVAGSKVQRWRLKADQAGRTVVAHRSGGSWHRWWRFRGEGQFRAGGKPIRLHTPHGAARYRGGLALAGTARDTVNDLSMEHYLRGVVPREVPATWHRNAVRAQAVAARTYAAYEKRHPRAGHYQLCDTTSCQVYDGYEAEHPASNKAIKATRRVILKHGGAPAFTQFASSSGGWTDANQFPYLPAKKDRWDKWSGNPVHAWRVSVPASRIQSAWPSIGKLKRINVKQRNGHGTWGGRVRTLVLVGKAGKVRVTGDAFRSALGLRSNWFTFRPG